MNIIEQFKNGRRIHKIQPGSSIHYSRNMTTDNLSKATNQVGEYVLKGLGALGKFLNAGFTSPTYGTIGQVSYARNAKDAKRQREQSEASEQAMGKAMTWMSPLNYGTALATGNGLDAKKGEEEVVSWSPAWQAVGRLGELYVGPKAVKGVKTAPKVVVNTAAKAGIKPAKAAVVARETNNVINKGFIKQPRKRGPKWQRELNWQYIIDNEATAPQILESWWLDKELNSGNKNSLVHFDRGDFKPNYWLEDYEGKNIKGAYIKNNELVNPNNNELYWFPGKPFAEQHWQHKPYSRFNVPSRYITVDRSSSNFVDKPFSSGGEEVYETVSRGSVNLDNAKIIQKSPFGWWERVKVQPGIEGKQLRLVSPGTYPLYRGPKFDINEIVNSDGTINPRKAMQAQHTVAKQFGKDAYKMEDRLENPEWHKEDPNTYEHTKRVTQSAWKLPTPEGYTKQDQMIAALGHDFGKIISGDGHEQIGADLVEQAFIDIKPYQLQAIREHMGQPTTRLGEVTQAADMLNGRDFSYLQQTSPELYNKIFRNKK